MDNNRLSKNLIAIFAGTFLGVALFWVGAFFSLIILAQRVNRDEELNDVMKSGNTYFVALCIISFIASFLGGLITTKLAADKTNKPALITGLLLTLMILAINNFWVSMETSILYACMLFPALLGAYIILKKINNNSSFNSNQL